MRFKYTSSDPCAGRRTAHALALTFLKTRSLVEPIALVQNLGFGGAKSQRHRLALESIAYNIPHRFLFQCC
jgi:hypothetical protein